MEGRELVLQKMNSLVVVPDYTSSVFDMKGELNSNRTG